MTRPIYEPSLQRTDARLNYGQNQLFRRPGQQPDAAGTAIEWIALFSDTNWGATLTRLEFSGFASSYDTVTPTFNINGDDNLEIFKAGDYYIDLWLLENPSDGSGTTWAHTNIEISRLAGGPAPVGRHGWTAGVGYPQLTLGYIPDEPLVPDMGLYFHDFVHWDDGDFVATPTEFEINAVRYIDGVETIWNEAEVTMLVVRIGDPYPSP